jgi:Raf kinase inhibitor-like YbhB/YbcL family protein
MADFRLTSGDIRQGEQIGERHVFNGFGYSGPNESPALEWSGAPEGTRSFALMMHDPDAPTGSGWWHWVVYDIPANVTSLPRGAGGGDGKGLPGGAKHGRTDFGSKGYGGPAPPPGKTHHYHFKLFALKVDKLEVPEDASAALIGFNCNGNALAVAELMGTYRNPNG